MTCLPAGRVFLLASLSPNFSRHLPTPYPLPLLWCAEVVPSPQREGDFLFFQKGEWPPSPFCIPQRDFPARRGHAQILEGRDFVFSFALSGHAESPEADAPGLLCYAK